MHPFLLSFGLQLSAPATAETPDAVVSTLAALRSAVATAAPGDTVWVAPGTYRLDTPLDLAVSGTAEAPLTLQAADPGTVLFEVNQPEGFRIFGAHWTVRGLDFVGVCASDSTCEHALHLAGDADGTVVEDCVMQDFNAQIKSNGLDGRFPDDVVVQGNQLFNTAPRDTANPVVPIDVVGGQRWHVEANEIRDFAKAGGNQVSYAAFFKGNSAHGRFVRNLVVCEDTHTGFTRVGLSLGGGGSSPDGICENSDCRVEHTGGLLENNIIVNCPEDVGIYLNAAADTEVRFNLLWDTTGIDVRFAASSALLEGNVTDGPVRERNGGRVIETDNRWSFPGFSETYRDPAAGRFQVDDATDLRTRLSEVPAVDFCGAPRTGAPLLGPMAEGSDCDTQMAHVGAADDDDETGSGPTDEPGGDTGSAGGAGGSAGDDDGEASAAPPRDAAGFQPAGCSTAPGRGHGLLAAGALLGLVGGGRRRRPSA